MPEFHNLDDLKAWLKGRRRQRVIVMAARIALRTVPMMNTAFGWGDVGGRRALLLSTFRVISVTNACGLGKAPRPILSVAAAQARERAALHARAATDATTTAANNVRAATVATATVATATRAAAAAATAAHARSATSSAAAAAAAATTATVATVATVATIWRAISNDAISLEDGRAASDLLTDRLWEDGMPEDLTGHWHNLRARLLADGDHWRVWTKWYQDRLDGKPLNEALETEKALIPEEDWDQGPAHVNAIIADLIAKHAEAATPQAETISLNPETGLIEIEQRPLDPKSALANACDKVRDQLADLRRKFNELDLSELRPVIEKLERTVTDYEQRERRVHDDFARSLVRIAELRMSGKIEDAVVVDDLEADLQDGVDDIRASFTEVDQMARARALARIERLSDDDREKLSKAADAAAENAAPDLAEELDDDAKVIVGAPHEPVPSGGLPDGAERDAGYRLGGRLIRIWRLVRDRERLIQIFEGTVKAADKLDKLAKGAAWIGAGILAVYFLVGF